MAGLVAALAAGLALAPAEAGAANATVRPSGEDTVLAQYTAASGEGNVVSISTEGSGVLIRDAGAAITPGAGCVSRAANVVFCEVRRGVVFVDTGDRDDSLARADSVRDVQFGSGDDELVDPSPASAEGGEGNDRLPASYGASRGGGPGDDILIGSPGNDSLVGGPGVDTLVGNGGDDALVDGDQLAPGASASSDQFDGGPGVDTVSYAQQLRPLTVDLRRGTDQGSAGEGDRFQSIENVLGGSRDDRLTGTENSDKLGGSGGRDLIRGLGGADELLGGGGRDAIEGGPGADLVDAASTFFHVAAHNLTDKAPDVFGERVSCGGGRDAARAIRDVVAPDCERVNEIGYPRLRGGRAVMALPCERHLWRGGRRCRPRIRLVGSRSACPRISTPRRRLHQRVTLRRPGRRGFRLPRGCRHGRYGIRVDYGDLISRFTATIGRAPRPPSPTREGF